jgi:hypothetical protein
MYKETNKYMELNIGDILICTKGYNHPNMGTVCIKNKRYKIFNISEDKNNTYNIGTVKNSKSWWVDIEFIKEHFVKGE